MEPERRYFCPKCDAALNPNVKIILTARRRDEEGLILLDPQPGNYQSIVAEEFPLEATDLVEFHCPVCGHELTAESNGEMACLAYRFSTGKNGTVYFARRYGEHATYFVSDDDVQSFGENALQNVGLNYFGSGHGEE
jgi:hypothetical protein